MTAEAASQVRETKVTTNSNEPKLEKLSEMKERLSEKGVGTPPPWGEKPASPLPVVNRLVSFGEKITYTLLHQKEVVSIHFDRGRGEIYYKGHNLKNMEVSTKHLEVLEKLRLLLESSPDGKPFAQHYGQALDKIILQKKKNK
ncbi:MAG: hypothetical protein HYY44_09125 [Deltaproteobacteria bacterium]|nr:hypothetical protein [Deltaproteobacteria bacterium]